MSERCGVILCPTCKEEGIVWHEDAGHWTVIHDKDGKSRMMSYGCVFDYDPRSQSVVELGIEAREAALREAGEAFRQTLIHCSQIGWPTDVQVAFYKWSAALATTSKAGERYQAMKRVCEAAAKMVTADQSDTMWDDYWYALTDELDALEALDELAKLDN